MDYAVIGGDARFACLTHLLCREGLDARMIGGEETDVRRVPRADADALKSTKNVIMNWPHAQSVEILTRIAPGAKVFFCGPGRPAEIPDGIRWVNLWEDEMLLLENAWLTAEGAIHAAMNTLDRSLRDCHCMVIGWGRIGKALTEMLVGLNARVTVASRSPQGRNGAVIRGAESASTYELKEALRGKQAVFSTPPYPVLDEAALGGAEPDVRIIDLASAPYGVDLEAARAIGIRAWRESGVPGRYCPFSAACALRRAVRRAEKEENV